MTEKTENLSRYRGASKPRSPTKRELWKQQSLDLAQEGNEAAIDILWKEFGINYAKDGGLYV